MNANLTAEHCGVVSTVEDAKDVVSDADVRVALIETLDDPKQYFMIIDTDHAFAVGDAVKFRLTVDYVTKVEAAAGPQEGEP
jgi:hypothetical protein